MRPDDRILHYALTRLLGSERDRPDLTGRIVDAWKRGESGDAAGTELGDPSGARPSSTEPRSETTRRDGALRGARGRAIGTGRVAALKGLAVAAGLLALAWLGWSTLRPEQPGPESESTTAALDVRTSGAPPEVRSPAAVAAPYRAQADGPLLAFDSAAPAQLEELEAGRLPEGVLAQVPEGPARTVDLGGGVRLVAWPRAVFALADDGVRFAAGTLRIEAAANAAPSPDARLRTPFAEVRVDPGGGVIAHLESDDPLRPELRPAALARLAGTGRADVALLLSVEVTVGAAHVLHRSGSGPETARTLYERASGAFSSVDAERAEQASLAAKERAFIAGRLLDLSERLWEEERKLAGARGTNLAPEPQELSTPEEFLAWLDARPTRWVLLAEEAARALEEPVPMYGRSVLTALVEAPHQRALATARALWRQRPDAFTPPHLVLLADRGAFEFERELRAMVDAWDASDAGAGALPFDAPVLPAAWLARRGDDRGAELLGAALALPISTPESMLRNVYGGLGLAALGDERAVPALLDSIARAGLGLLENGLVSPAADVAVVCDWIATETAAGRTLGLVSFFDDVDEHALAHAERFANPVAVGALLESFVVR